MDIEELDESKLIEDFDNILSNEGITTPDTQTNETINFKDLSNDNVNSFSQIPDDPKKLIQKEILETKLERERIKKEKDMIQVLSKKQQLQMKLHQIQQSAIKRQQKEEQKEKMKMRQETQHKKTNKRQEIDTNITKQPQEADPNKEAVIQSFLDIVKGSPTEQIITYDALKSMSVKDINDLKQEYINTEVTRTKKILLSGKYIKKVIVKTSGMLENKFPSLGGLSYEYEADENIEQLIDQCIKNGDLNKLMNHITPMRQLIVALSLPLLSKVSLKVNKSVSHIENKVTHQVEDIKQKVVDEVHDFKQKSFFGSQQHALSWRDTA